LIFVLLISIIGIAYTTRRMLNEAAATNRKQARDLAVPDDGVKSSIRLQSSSTQAMHQAEAT
jgi:hypothetical protein